MSAMRSIEAMVVVRAVAIVLVVANHAEFGVSLHGGLNALLIVSGLSAARFGFGTKPGAALRTFARTGLRLAIPSFVLSLICQFCKGTFNWAELAFYSNWLNKSRVVMLPIWYSQAVVQMLIFLAALFVLTGMQARIARRPLLWAGVLYAGACIVALISYAVWDTAHLADKLPHLILWNFAFGWLVWAVQGRLQPLSGRLLLSGVLGISIAVLFLGVRADHGTARALLVPLIVLPLIWFDRISLPSAAARATFVVSQATLFIFLFHYFGFWFIGRLGRLIGLEPEAQNPVLRLVVGICGPVALWAIWTATMRVYWRGYRLWPKSNVA